MDISSNGGSSTSKKLSNFSANGFIMDGVKIASMEGFLQSLKTKSVDMQEHICTLVGMGAKRAGAGKDWKKRQILYWGGIEYKRGSKEYQELLDRAYESMYNQNESFRKALNSTSGVLSHSVGKNKIADTVITTQEFCGRLMRLRDKGHC